MNPRRSFHFWLSVLAVLGALCPQQLAHAERVPTFSGNYHLQTKPGRRVKLTLEGTIQTPGFDASSWCVFLAKVPDHHWQKVESQSIQLVVDDRENSRVKSETLSDPNMQGRQVCRLLYTPIRPTSSVRFSYEVEVTLNEVKLVEGRTREKPPVLSKQDRQNALEARGAYDFDSKAFQAYMAKHNLRRSNKERDLAFAFRVLSHIHDKYSYRYPPKFEDRLATHVCEEGASDCGGLSILFSSVMRANGIPARVLCGRWAQTDKPNDPQFHVRAEFWADGVGWVPIDGSGAVQWQGAPASAFGTQRDNFFVMHEDLDFDVDTQVFGKQSVRLLQSPACWVRGNGKFSGLKHDSTWTVKDVGPGK